jgi:hypothetical protein
MSLPNKTSNITIGYCYYEDKERFRRVLEHYSCPFFDDISFIVVDDGSKNYPIERKNLPSNWTLYRITKDVGWNNEGARNLVMHVLKTKFAMLLDCDFWIAEEEMRYLLEIEKDLNEKTLYFFQEGLHTFPNLITGELNDNCTRTNRFMTTKEYFWDLGGYDETFRYYGCDGFITHHPKLSYEGLEIYLVNMHGKEMRELIGRIPTISDSYFDTKKENEELTKTGYFTGKAKLSSKRLRYNWEEVLG